MKSIWTILLTILIVLLLNLQPGCQEAKKAPRQQQTISEPAQDLKVSESTKPKTAEIAKSPIQTQTKASPGQGDKKPVIKVFNPVHDFGKVAPNKKYNCEFKFKNIGDARLEITKIQTTCGCTVPQLKKKTYAPGESGTIDVTFRSPTREGKTTKHLYILSNDKKNPKFNLTLNANVEVQVSFEPKSLNLSFKAENAGAKPITVKSRDGQLFAIKSISSTRNVITADFDPADKATEFVIEPKVDISLLKNNLKGNVKINTTHPQTGSIDIPYSTLALFEVSRPRIVIRNADPAKPDVKTVWVTSNYGEKVEIESVSSLKGHMKVLTQQSEENGVKLEVQTTPPAQTDESERYFRDELRIKLKDYADDLVIRCNGWYSRKSAESK